MTAPKLFCDSIYIKGLGFTLESVAKPLASSAGCGASYVLLQGWTGWKLDVLSWLYCVVRKKAKLVCMKLKEMHLMIHIIWVMCSQTIQRKRRTDEGTPGPAGGWTVFFCKFKSPSASLCVYLVWNLCLNYLFLLSFQTLYKTQVKELKEEFEEKNRQVQEANKKVQELCSER